MKKIDYLTVCYLNYDLILLQLENFKKRFNRESYRFIVVDNTPKHKKNQIRIDELKNHDGVDVLIEIKDSRDSTATNRGAGIDEGVSHGSALEEGLKHCTSEIVCMFDSDFFFLDNNINEYIWDKFNDGYQAVGTSFDASDFHKSIIDRNPLEFENIPVIYGAFYTNELAKSVTLIATKEETESSYQSGGSDVETGFRLRKYIASNNIKSMAWGMKRQHSASMGTQFINNEHNEIIAVHGWAGSHRNNRQGKVDELRKIVQDR